MMSSVYVQQPTDFFLLLDLCDVRVDILLLFVISIQSEELQFDQDSQDMSMNELSCAPKVIGVDQH